MSYAIKIEIKNNLVISRTFEWNDLRDIIIIEKYLDVDSADVRSLTDSIDAWVDDKGLLKKGNLLISLIVNGENLIFSKEILLLGLDYETGKTRGLNKEELKWIKHNLFILDDPIGIIK
ncbi:hypothetical protein SAMN05878443_2363 [Carnobacterium alterfunditum]|uniref:Uncharacterized protein n=1 Tax=Carnobacterium alterfunditum TaxID=28230 RepID=A0A1N6IIS9_9LACT|nr:hypothetical protein [Carnobacterium alterfunditum]SIO31927.1 hypothetical protein SAMN05878443_2363 [Carnobacterium alterfunditum]